MRRQKTEVSRQRVERGACFSDYADVVQTPFINLAVQQLTIPSRQTYSKTNVRPQQQIHTQPQNILRSTAGASSSAQPRPTGTPAASQPSGSGPRMHVPTASNSAQPRDAPPNASNSAQPRDTPDPPDLDAGPTSFSAGTGPCLHFDEPGHDIASCVACVRWLEFIRRCDSILPPRPRERKADRQAARGTFQPNRPMGGRGYDRNLLCVRDPSCCKKHSSYHRFRREPGS